MLNRWLRLWNELRCQGDGASVFQTIAARYQEPHRAYHTLEHIRHCLDEFEEIRHLGTVDAHVVEMALWLHDVVYDPLAKDNEEQSGMFAAAMGMHAEWSASFTLEVLHCILATKHDESPEDVDARYVVDIDLSSLGVPEDVFRQNGIRLRQEYAAVPDAAFVQGQRVFFTGLLSRPHLYQTEFFAKKYEDQARENIRSLLARIAQSPG